MIHDIFRNILLEAEKEQGQGQADPDETSETGANIDSLDDAKAALAEARKDAAKYRTRSKEFDATKARLEKLESGLKGIFGDNEEVNPEKLKERTQSLESELKAERVKNSVTIQAINEGLDPDLTIAYLQTKGKLKDIDYNDSNAVNELISSAAKDKPNLKVTKADKVGSGDETVESDNGKDLNPIDAYRRKIGILPNNSK